MTKAEYLESIGYIRSLDPDTLTYEYNKSLGGEIMTINIQLNILMIVVGRVWTQRQIDSLQIAFDNVNRDFEEMQKYEDQIMTKGEYLESIGYRKSTETIYYKYNEGEDYCEKIIDLKYKNRPNAFFLNAIIGIHSLEAIDAIKLEFKALEADFKEMKKYED